MKKIPGTRYVWTKLAHIRSLKKENPLKLWCLKMINPATGWFEMAQIPNKTAAEIADITKKTWFTRFSTSTANCV